MSLAGASAPDRVSVWNVGTGATSTIQGNYPSNGHPRYRRGRFDEGGRVAVHLAEAAERVERLKPRLAEARRELHAAIRDAHAEGASLGTIGRVAGLSRERVRRLVSAD